MRRITLGFFVAIVTIGMAWAQNQPPGTISQQPPPPTTHTNQPSQPATTANLTFTNSAGTVFTVDQLAGQLQNLRQSVDQTLPMLNAFTQTYSNTVPGGLGGAIAGILGRVLNPNTNAAGTPGQSSQATNLWSVLQGVLNTNAPGGTAVNPAAVSDLLALQDRLQALPPLLDRLNVGTNANEVATPSSEPSTQNRPLPTGR